MVSVWWTVSRAVHVAVCRWSVAVSCFSVSLFSVMVEALVVVVVASTTVFAVVAVVAVETERRCVAQERKRRERMMVRNRMKSSVRWSDK